MKDAKTTYAQSSDIKSRTYYNILAINCTTN